MSTEREKWEKISAEVADDWYGDCQSVVSSFERAMLRTVIADAIENAVAEDRKSRVWRKSSLVKMADVDKMLAEHDELRGKLEECWQWLERAIEDEEPDSSLRVYISRVIARQKGQQ